MVGKIPEVSHRHLGGRTLKSCPLVVGANPGNSRSNNSDVLPAYHVCAHSSADHFTCIPSFTTLPDAYDRRTITTPILLTSKLKRGVSIRARNRTNPQHFQPCAPTSPQHCVLRFVRSQQRKQMAFQCYGDPHATILRSV